MTHTHASGQRHLVVIPLFYGVRSLTFSGPADVLAGAGEEGFRHDVLTAPEGTPVRASSGLALVPDTSLADVPEVGRETADVIAALSARPRRLASVCAGAFLRAGTGLLDGRTAATRRQHARELMLRHPAGKADAHTGRR
ncbi:helix-turn-helix domain-containing protein [Streptomyces ipomoeae]|uniref:hypothetical protein n=1 Tax=Streptomyces ipomoeae TaxID=103232 RepID=UPI0002D77D1B|nr:hypothetical protein [Streptomyces ipomoeae]MDX2693912.1 hypothetical protein [Streptomyces ipomoeae]MDX2839812.1 hypothetical protein [Streptomyces ipomoeae]